MINPVYPLASCDTKTVGADTPAISRASRILEHLAMPLSHSRVISGLQVRERCRDFCYAAERDAQFRPKGTIKRRALTDNEAVYPIESPEHERTETSLPMCSACKFPGIA